MKKRAIFDAYDAIEKSVLHFFRRKGWFNNDEVEKILGYENTGFSLDAKVKIHSFDRNGPWLTYRLPKPCHTGKISIQLEPIEFLDKIAALIPPPRRHRHHYHGAFFKPA